MEKSIRNDKNDDQINNDQDQLRGNTMNETIREVNGDPDMNLNEIRDTDDLTGTAGGSGASGTHNADAHEGMGWNPNDASAVRSGGTTDMDDQTAGGAGLNTGGRRGAGSNMSPKKGVTGSDFDGQNASS